jgi:hypothetical protein
MTSEHVTRLRARLVGIGSQTPRRDKNISLFYTVPTGSGAHTASYTMDTGRSFPGGKAVGA